MYLNNNQHQSDLEEPESVYGIRLTPTVYRKLVEFFNLHENIGLRQSDVIDKLLLAVEELLRIRNQTSIVSTISKRSAQLLPSPNKTPKRKSARFAAEEAEEAEEDIGIYRSIVHIEDEQEEESDGDDNEDDEEINYDFLMDDEEQSVQLGLTTTANTVVSTHPSRKNKNSATSDPDYSSNVSKKSTPKKVGRPAGRKSAAKTPKKRSSTNQKGNQSSNLIGLRQGLGTGKQKPHTSQLRRLIYAIMLKRQRNNYLHCRQCNRSILVSYSTHGLRFDTFLDHICGHAGKPIMYACRLCSHRTITKVAIRAHVRKIHQGKNEFDDLTDQFYQELSERISNCFDYDQPIDLPINGGEAGKTLSFRQFPAGPGQRIKTRSNQEIRRLIFDLITKWKNGNALYCRHCNDWIRLGRDRESPSIRTQLALNHLCSDFNVLLYRCKICDQRTTTNFRMMAHLQRVHQLKSISENSEELDDYETDFKEMMIKCYDWDEGSGPPQLSPGTQFLKQRRAVGGRPRRHVVEEADGTSGSCRLEGFAYSRRLAEQFGGGSSTIKCRRCDAKIGLHKGSANYLFAHALIHCDRAAYECRICQVKMKRRDYVQRHYLRNHKDIKTIDYIDRTGETKEEIMEMMKQCFDSNYTNVIRQPGLTRLKAIRYTKPLIKNFSNDLKMKCRLCQLTISVKNATNKCPRSTRSAELYTHGLLHTENYSYECKICNETKKNKLNMITHMKINHKEIDRKDFIDHTDRMEEEILDTMKRCFDLNFNQNVEEEESGISGINVFIE